jgi:pilus assembly protein Flp/PilA
LWEALCLLKKTAGTWAFRALDGVDASKNVGQFRLPDWRATTFSLLDHYCAFLVSHRRSQPLIGGTGALLKPQIGGWRSCGEGVGYFAKNLFTSLALTSQVAPVLKRSRLMLQRIKKTTARLWNDENGASLLEYSVLIGLIVAGVVASIAAVAGWTGTRWTNLLGVLNNSTPQ